MAGARTSGARRKLYTRVDARRFSRIVLVLLMIAGTVLVLS
jgi:hypothetical protein